MSFLYDASSCHVMFFFFSTFSQFPNISDPNFAITSSTITAALPPNEPGVRISLPTKYTEAQHIQYQQGCVWEKWVHMGGHLKPSVM